MPSNTKILHNKEQEIFEVLLNKVYTFIFSLIMFWCAVTVIIVGQILSSWEIELRLTHIDQWKLLGSIFLLIIFHEALHAFAALLWGKVPWSSLHFGFTWQWFAFYCHCDKPLKVNTYRIFALFPLIVTTLIAGLILWLDPSIWALFFFGGTVAACAGDVLLFFRTRQVKNNKWIQDHPSEPGFYILPEAISVSTEEHQK